MHWKRKGRDACQRDSKERQRCTGQHENAKENKEQPKYIPLRSRGEQTTPSHDQSVSCNASYHLKLHIPPPTRLNDNKNQEQGYQSCSSPLFQSLIASSRTRYSMRSPISSLCSSAISKRSCYSYSKIWWLKVAKGRIYSRRSNAGGFCG